MNNRPLSKFLPGRLANVFAAAGKELPSHLVGLNYDKLYRIKGFAHASFHDLSKRLWDMGLHFDDTGTIRDNADPKEGVALVVTPFQLRLIDEALSYLDGKGGWADHGAETRKALDDLHVKMQTTLARQDDKKSVPGYFNPDSGR